MTGRTPGARLDELLAQRTAVRSRRDAIVLAHRRLLVEFDHELGVVDRAIDELLEERSALLIDHERTS